MKKLSMTDWAFLEVETPERQTHVAGLWIFQLPKGYRGDFFQNLRDGLPDWRHVGPPFNYKLKSSWVKWDLPGWVEDPRFDLDNHVHFHTLPNPGTRRQLLEWVEERHSQPLDRSRPLWEVHFISGIENRQIAIYSKVHHALFDGIGGLNLMVKTFSQSPDAHATHMLWQPPAQPRARNPLAALLTRAGKRVSDISTHLRALPEFSLNLAKSGLQAANLRHNAVPLPFSAPKTLLNVPISAKRRIAVHTAPLSEVRRLGQRAHATVNDVVLAMCSGALRRYLDDKRALPNEPLIAFMPISTRSDRNDPVGGNQVAAVLCSLVTTQSDARQRLACIKASARAAKHQFNEQSPAANDQTLLLFGSLLMLIQRLKLSPYLAPPANVVISNVRGPGRTLYLNGARLVGQYPLSMLIDGLAVNITVTSHGDSLDFGLVTCGAALPDVDTLAYYLGEAFAELQIVFSSA
ncbi:MAG: wax ester/triacylglycerol synthase family O-acyltransferase [Gammaproteobacteria bacterium]|nr:wax ester/triacylglycerol synthase family O-acyltransferase [Gammaproteobacteria bacterium]